MDRFFSAINVVVVGIEGLLPFEVDAASSLITLPRLVMRKRRTLTLEIGDAVDKENCLR